MSGYVHRGWICCGSNCCECIRVKSAGKSTSMGGDFCGWILFCGPCDRTLKVFTDVADLLQKFLKRSHSFAEIYAHAAVKILRSMERIISLRYFCNKSATSNYTLKRGQGKKMYGRDDEAETWLSKLVVQYKI